MTIVSAKTLSSEDLRFLGINVSRQVLSDRRRCHSVRFARAKRFYGSSASIKLPAKQRFDSLVMTEVK
jgi:hypothetical protein